MSERFKIYSQYYNLLYKDKDYTREAQYIDDILVKYGIAGRKVLEFGAGTGIHGCLLAEKGYVVKGIELSEEMVKQAKQVKGFTIQHGDICSVIVDESFDAIISLFHVLSYQVKNESIQAVFANASRHLNKNGLFVFDIWYTPAVYAQKPQVRVKRMEQDDLQIIRIAEPEWLPNDSVVNVHFTIHAIQKDKNELHSFQEKHPMRHFSMCELDLLAAFNGFERIGAEEFMTGATPGENTWGVCIILKKI